MQEQLDYIVQKLDKMDDKQDQMNETLVRNTLTVELHEKRSTALEGMVQGVIKERVIPIENHVALVNLLVKIAVGLAGVATTILALWAGIKAVF